jgi:hypothetical protein
MRPASHAWRTDLAIQWLVMIGPGALRHRAATVKKAPLEPKILSAVQPGVEIRTELSLLNGLLGTGWAEGFGEDSGGVANFAAPTVWARPG